MAKHDLQRRRAKIRVKTEALSIPFDGQAVDWSCELSGSFPSNSAAMKERVQHSLSERHCVLR